MVLSCAGAYVSGAAGSNACPAGSVRIKTEAACRIAAAAAGKTLESTFVETSPYAPQGCYYRTHNNVACFNADTYNDGAGSSYAKLLCAATVTAGAPLTRRCAAAEHRAGTRGYSRDRPDAGVRGCCGTAEGPRVPVLSCAGAYVSGAAGSNECPAGSARIETEAACRTAAAAAGKTSYPSYFVETDPRSPRGCYYIPSNNDAYFNAHAVGAGYSGAQLLCAAANTGAPLKRRCATRVYCAVLAGGVPSDANGLNVCIHVHMRTRMVPALAGGAARRTAAQADGGRACTGAAR